MYYIFPESKYVAGLNFLIQLLLCNSKVKTAPFLHISRFRVHACVTPLETLVFDTCNVHNDRAYGLDFHLDRLLKSATTARIEHDTTKESLRDIILATIAAGGRKKGDAFAKYWLSAGRRVGGIPAKIETIKMAVQVGSIELASWISNG